MTELKIACPHCDQRIEVSEDMSGEVIECPSCEKLIALPRIHGARVAKAGGSRALVLVGDFLRFRIMVAPTIIQVFFWLGAVAAIAFGIKHIVSGARMPGGDTLMIIGVLWIILGPLVVRILCELVLVVFSINNALVEMTAGLRGDTEIENHPDLPPDF